MSELFYGIILIALAFFLHISIWRIRQPTHQKSILICIFSITLIAGSSILFYFRQHISLLGIRPPQELYEYFQIFIFFISVSLAYMVTYSALEADSPSLVMIMTIANSGSEGLPQKTFEEKINNDTLIIPRLNDALSEKLVYLNGDKYNLTPKCWGNR
jgi:hypothetical protein